MQICSSKILQRRKLVKTKTKVREEVLVGNGINPMFRSRMSVGIRNHAQIKCLMCSPTPSVRAAIIPQRRSQSHDLNVSSHNSISQH